MKRIVTVQDISCVGKCSLTVALPIISALGVECAVIPTAVLSTHTAFSGFTFCDLTDEIEKISAHWQNEKIDFDAIYTGYLGSFRQIELMKKFFSDNPGAMRFVDPAMGDNGKLYPGFTEDFAKEMASLCAMADVIVPNITEAAFMLGAEYKGEGYDEAYVKDLLDKLTSLGAKKAMITGVSLEPGKLGVMMKDSETGEYESYYTEKIEKMYHGTGDVFASACLGALVRGKDLKGAAKIAADFTVESIKCTVKDRESNWYGVNFEEAIGSLTDAIKR